MHDLLRRCRNLLSHPPLWWKDNEANRERLIADLDVALAEPEERNFCPRCGKRSHADAIHTCTPPLEAGQTPTHTSPVAWQWLDTATFKARRPERAVVGEWRPLYPGPFQ